MNTMKKEIKLTQQAYIQGNEESFLRKYNSDGIAQADGWAGNWFQAAAGTARATSTWCTGFQRMTLTRRKIKIGATLAIGITLLWCWTAITKT